MNQKIVTFVGLALLALLAIGQVFTAGRGFSDMENRYLKTRPQASWEDIRSGAYMDQMEAYLADHVPGRDEWVKLKNTTVYLSGRRQIGSVVFAEGGRLIQVQAALPEQYQPFTQLEKNVGLLSDWMEALPEEIPVHFLLIPNASWIYREQMPEETLTYDPEAACRAVTEGLPGRVQVTVPYEELRAHRDEAIYFRSDHHWTMRGAAYGYMALAEALGIDGADPFRYETVTLGHDFKGSVYSQAPIFGYAGEDFEVIQTPGLDASWRTETASGQVFMKEKLAEKDMYAAFFGGNYGLTRIVNEKAQTSEKLLILKDSYANILLPFLIEDYGEIVMVDLRYFRGSVTDLLQEEAIDRVICVYNLDFLCTDPSFVWLGV